jgi:3-keto steroid reductase
VSHLVCNAGVAPYLNISWPLFLRQVWRNLLELNMFELVTLPSYNIQRKAMMSDDGLGWVWQCNVFGHYILVRLSSSPVTPVFGIYTGWPRVRRA